MVYWMDYCWEWKIFFTILFGPKIRSIILAGYGGSIVNQMKVEAINKIGNPLIRILALRAEIIGKVFWGKLQSLRTVFLKLLHSWENEPFYRERLVLHSFLRKNAIAPVQVALTKTKATQNSSKHSCAVFAAQSTFLHFIGYLPLTLVNRRYSM